MKDIALHILDIVQNSIRAAASEIRITVDESPDTDLLTLTITDNGKGMDEETCKKASDPWFTSRTTRKIGMGLPLLQMNASLSGGEMKLSSVPGKVTSVTATFGYNHVDRPPLGDIGGTIALLISSNPGLNIVYNHLYNGRSWGISTEEIKEALGESDVSDLSLVKYIREIIIANISGVTNP